MTVRGRGVGVIRGVGESAVVFSGGVLGRLRARRGELVGAIFERVRGDAFDCAGAYDLEYVEGLRGAVGAAVEYALEGIEHGEGWGGPVPGMVVEQARRAARVGVSLDTVLRRYVVGHTMLGEFVMAEAERGGGGDAVTPVQRGAVRCALRAQAAVLDRLLCVVTGEYRDELARVGRSVEQRRAERVRRLLESGVVGEAELVEVDYELDAWHLGAIVTGAGAARAVRELAVGLDRRLLCVVSGRESVWAWLGGQDRLEIAALERMLSGLEQACSVGPDDHRGVREDRAEVLSGGVSFAVGEPAYGFEGWRLTHQQAQAALVVALRRSRGFTRYADVALLASALKDEMLARVLIDVYVAPLEDPRGGAPVLRETLRAYLLAERSVSSAAAALGVVRKTVETRLRTIEEKLGRALHPCPAALEVALELGELTQAPGPPSGPPEVSIVDEIIV